MDTNSPKVQHLILDYSNLKTFDLTNSNFFNDVASKVFSECKLTVVNNLVTENKPEGYSQVYLLSNAHLTFHTYPSSNSLTVDLYINDSNSREKVERAEEILSDYFGWENCYGSIYLDRSGPRQTLMNSYYHSATLYKGFTLLHREKSPFQEIRVFDSQEMGKVLALDNMIQITELPDDNYTIDLCSLVVDTKRTFENLLLIGAGDMIIPSYLLNNKNFNIRRIDLVEIDERVYQNTKKYFKGMGQIDEFVSKGSLNLIFDDGAKFLKTKVSENFGYDGIIIDNSDVFLFDGPAASLFTDEFYSNIYQCLKPGAFFSQQVSDENVKAKWESMVRKVGFTEINVIYSTTPEYSVRLPMAAAKKN